MNIPAPTECPYYLISRVYLEITSKLKQNFRKKNLEKVNPSFLGILFALSFSDSIKTSALGKLVGLESSTMTGLIDRMENAGLVKRVADPDDKRANLIVLTKEGLKSCDQVAEISTEVLKDIFVDIREEDLSTTINVLKQVLINSKRGIFK